VFARDVLQDVTLTAGPAMRVAMRQSPQQGRLIDRLKPRLVHLRRSPSLRPQPRRAALLASGHVDRSPRRLKNRDALGCSRRPNSGQVRGQSPRRGIFAIIHHIRAPSPGSSRNSPAKILVGPLSSSRYRLPPRV